MFTKIPRSFVLDPNKDGFDTQLWYANSGTLALSGASPDQYRFNTDDGIVRADLRYAVIDFSVNFPTTGVQTPTNLVNDIAFGFKNASMGDFGKIDFFVDKSANDAAFRTYDDFGTLEETAVAWDTDWNSAQTIFRILWSPDYVKLQVLVNAETAWVTLVTHETSIPHRALNPFVNAVGADNFDVDFISILSAHESFVPLI